VNRWGQITAAGTVNNEPMTVCPTREIDPETGTLSVEEFACRNLHMFVLTPTRR
jgi:hypothetical protein